MLSHVSALPKELWMDKRREDVLDAPYFHVVFTVPQELNPIIYSNQQLLYDALYHSVSATINELTEDAKHLGAKVGYICILHTWGSEMNYHPHIHVILLGGGLTAKNQWRDKGEEFFLPVKVLLSYSEENICMNSKLYGKIISFNSLEAVKNTVIIILSRNC